MDENVEVKEEAVEVKAEEVVAEKRELLNTYGFDILAICDEAIANGNPEFADVVAGCIGNLQACFDIIAQKHTSTGGENLWNIDAGELKARLK